VFFFLNLLVPTVQIPHKVLMKITVQPLKLNFGLPLSLFEFFISSTDTENIALLENYNKTAFGLFWLKNNEIK